MNEVNLSIFHKVCLDPLCANSLLNPTVLYVTLPLSGRLRDQPSFRNSPFPPLARLRRDLAAAAMGHFDIGSLVSAWAYEANRIFRDRLVNSKSQDQFGSMPIAFSAIVWSVPNHRTSFTRCCDVVIQNNTGPRIERFSLISFVIHWYFCFFFR